MCPSSADPALGRPALRREAQRRRGFIQADTIIPNPANPQSLNRYAYTLNNPLRYTDPSGHIPIPPGILNGLQSAVNWLDARYFFPADLAASALIVTTNFVSDQNISLPVIDSGIASNGYQSVVGVQASGSKLIGISVNRTWSMAMNFEHGQIGVFDNVGAAAALALPTEPTVSAGFLVGGGPIRNLRDLSKDLTGFSSFHGAGAGMAIPIMTEVALDYWQGGLPWAPLPVRGELAALTLGAGIPGVGINVHYGIGHTQEVAVIRNVHPLLRRALVDIIYRGEKDGGILPDPRTIARQYN